jgi:hypothetical protein
VARQRQAATSAAAGEAVTPFVGEGMNMASGPCSSLLPNFLTRLLLSSFVYALMFLREPFHMPGVTLCRKTW